MKPYRLHFCFLVLCCIAVAGRGLSQSAPAPVPTRSDNDPATRKGFDYFYSLEYDKAVREFEATQQAHPETSRHAAPAPLPHVITPAMLTHADERASAVP